MTRPQFHSIRLSNKKCVDVQYGNCCDNAAIIAYPCHKGKNQKFAYRKTRKHLIARSSNKCVDVKNKKLIQRRCNNKTAKWTNYKGKWYHKGKALDRYI